MVDRNTFYEPLLHDKLQQHPSLHLEQLLHCSAENMSDVPDGSIDAVVSTLVLCSVSDVKQVLSEVKRVLAPVSSYYISLKKI
jgi:ubiquinone/menaquinone biosynthesis C-methylase UbiE